MLKVTSPSLPSKKIFLQYFSKIYKSKMLTSGGPLIAQFESKLKKFLGVEYLIFTNSGTNALMIALKTMKIKNSILTTPFSYISAANACHWLGIKVYFSDIKKDSLNLDPIKVSKKLLKKIEAILPVHSFGISCEIDKFEKLCHNNKVKIIYDAAHCFGLKYKNKSILSYGDASIVSLHATKVFNTCEGGIIVFKKKSDFVEAKKLINIGNSPNRNYPGEGINCRLNELQAAWGLSLLEKYEKLKNRRKIIFDLYKKYLTKKALQPLCDLEDNNYGYFPIILNNEKTLKKLMNILLKKKINARRYFYPALNEVNHLKKKTKTPIATGISRKILCLPISANYKKNQIMKVIKIININLK